jgi:hypothetical protein
LLKFVTADVSGTSDALKTTFEHPRHAPSYCSYEIVPQFSTLWTFSLSPPFPNLHAVMVPSISMV